MSLESDMISASYSAISSCSPSPNRCDSSFPHRQQVTRLPSIEDFDKGILALAQPVGSGVSSDHPSLSHERSVCPIEAAHPVYSPNIGSYMRYTSESVRGLTGSLPPVAQRGIISCQQHSDAVSLTGGHPVTGYEKADSDRKYTPEQGNWIIDAFVVKKMSWKTIKENYNIQFPSTPERTEQGLQAWYYRQRKKESQSVWGRA